MKIFAKVVDFLTRVCLEHVWDSGRVKIEWILDAFNKVFIWDFNPSFIYITITRSDVGKYNNAIQHMLVTFCNKSPLGGGGGGGIIYLRLEKRTVIKIITKAKLLGQ